uniref:Uncharacterized protein n=1 Tax=Molossus molossus TaxID=27622 RepID=A0A7J8HBY0_MOLMO|nr:hypothetical protein HJG59_011203 [Molossus molossus]
MAPHQHRVRFQNAYVHGFSPQMLGGGGDINPRERKGDRFMDRTADSRGCPGLTGHAHSFLSWSTEVVGLSVYSHQVPSRQGGGMDEKCLSTRTVGVGNVPPVGTGHVSEHLGGPGESQVTVARNPGAINKTCPGPLACSLLS